MNRRFPWISSFRSRNQVLFPVLTALALLAGCKSGSSPTTDGPVGSAASAADVIRIGEVGSLTGSEATFGLSTNQGIRLAFDAVNAAGGIKGKKLELITIDNQGKPEESATAVTRLITQNKVVAVLGEVASSRSMAMAPIAQNYKVPMISPSSTNPKVTELGDYIFRVCFIDPFQGFVMAKFAIETLKVKRVAVLEDVKNDYSVGLSKYFKETIRKMGGTVETEQSYSSGDIDFKSQLTSIKGKNPEVLFVPGYYTDVGLIARQAREIGLKIPLLGGDGWDSPKLIEIGGNALDGSYFSNHYSPEDQSPHIQEFIARFKERFGVIPDGLAASGYDAAMILIDAIKRASEISPSALREALAATKTYKGVTGTITMDNHRNAIKSAVVIQITDGQFKYLTTVEPS